MFGSGAVCTFIAKASVICKDADMIVVFLAKPEYVQ
jgi:hypothetical protein